PRKGPGAEMAGTVHPDLRSARIRGAQHPAAGDDAAVRLAVDVEVAVHRHHAADPPADRRRRLQVARPRGDLVAGADDSHVDRRGGPDVGHAGQHRAGRLRDLLVVDAGIDRLPLGDGIARWRNAAGQRRARAHEHERGDAQENEGDPGHTRPPYGPNAAWSDGNRGVVTGTSSQSIRRGGNGLLRNGAQRPIGGLSAEACVRDERAPQGQAAWARRNRRRGRSWPGVRASRNRPARMWASSMIVSAPEKSNGERPSAGRGRTRISTVAGAAASPRSKRWFRAMAKARSTTSRGLRTGASATPPDTLRTKIRSTGPARACDSGTLSTTPPSTSVRWSWRTGGKLPGSAALARRAGFSAPEASTTSSPVARSQATTRSGTTSSENW